MKQSDADNAGTAVCSTALPYVASAPSDPSNAVELPKLFHLAGTPVRAATASRDVFIGTPKKHPARWMLDLREWAVAGTYLLLSGDEGLSRGVYVGSAKDLVERVNEHQNGVKRTKADTFDWNQAILLTATGVTRGDAYQLERAVGDAVALSEVDLLVPAWEALPKFQARDTPWAVRDAVIVLAERCLRQLGVPARLLPPSQ
ncbi:MAG TPA: hypothetical protein VGX37_06685 [Allosphingosinicella sp.]|jgi:predicted GIY-YIG superfamily endonuclease|nr:hypothetical protein [Allosphingosinicella sp.]